ncbi:hypothetical protein, partial [Photobacterium minamisatsumaniensis]|uniref:hypothetical protein n=1 Tax=Photobacterium minamisatsumaniensis TaxID=2910233 RepID=UPI003D11B009
SLFLFSYLNDFSILLFSLMFLATLACYEIGYLYNDIITTKNEISPTIRNTEWFEAHLGLAVVIRVAFCLTCLLLVFVSTDIYSALLLLFGMFSIQLAFFFHNTVRSKLNIVSYFSLVSFRYVTPIIPFVSLEDVIIVILAFPLCRTIEHACKKKYGFSSLQSLISNFDIYRVAYYSLFTVLSYFVDDTRVVFYSFLYFACIRSLALAVSKLHFFKRSKHKSY